MDENSVKDNDLKSPFTVSIKKNKLNDGSSEVVLKEDNSSDHESDCTNKKLNSTADLKEQQNDSTGLHIDLNDYHADSPEHLKNFGDYVLLSNDQNNEIAKQQSDIFDLQNDLTENEFESADQETDSAEDPTNSVDRHNESFDKQDDSNYKQNDCDENFTDLQDTTEYHTNSAEHLDDLPEYLTDSDEHQANSADHKTDSESDQSVSSDQLNGSAPREGENNEVADYASDTCSSIYEPQINLQVPMENVLFMGPSTSGVHTILLNIKSQPSTSRFHTRHRPSDESDSSLDSDDEFASFRPVVQRSVNEERPEDDQGPSRSIVIEDNDEPPVRNVEEEAELTDNEHLSDNGFEHYPPEEVIKERPKHNYYILKEVRNRELGISLPRGKTTKDDVTFQQRFYGSLHAAYRMEKLHTLNKHTRSVHSVDFHSEGRLLATGSDDTNVIIWDWATRKPVLTIEAVHSNRIYQAKFLYLNSGSQLDIVTSARDGRINLLQYGGAGSTWLRRGLAFHSKAAVKVHVTPYEPQSVLSAGQDGLILHSDLRTDVVNRVVHVKQRGTPIPVQSVHGHPLNPMEIVVAPQDVFVRLYDRRKSNKPLALYGPTVFTEAAHIVRRTIRLNKLSLTSAVYNHDGTDILGSYTYDHIYLFNIKNDVYDPNLAATSGRSGYTQRYKGHRNNYALKSVSFYGPHSEYIMSGSDCGNFFMWEKQSESIVQFLPADSHGVVNVVEPHPRYPILASCGVDKDVKIWAPYNNEDPSFQGLANTIRQNNASDWQNPLYTDILPTFYRSWSGDSRLDTEDVPFSNTDIYGNICTAF